MMAMPERLRKKVLCNQAENVKSKKHRKRLDSIPKQMCTRTRYHVVWRVEFDILMRRRAEVLKQYKEKMTKES